MNLLWLVITIAQGLKLQRMPLVPSSKTSPSSTKQPSNREPSHLEHFQTSTDPRRITTFEVTNPESAHPRSNRKSIRDSETEIDIPSEITSQTPDQSPPHSEDEYRSGIDHNILKARFEQELREAAAAIREQPSLREDIAKRLRSKPKRQRNYQTK